MKLTLLFVSIFVIQLFSHSQMIYGETQKVVASDRNSNDRFAYAISIDNDYAVSGAYTEDEDELGANFLSSAGSAYIYEKNMSGNWVEVQKIVSPDRQANDYFGWSVAISGDYLAIGAYQEDEDESGMNTFSNAGSVYIFERDGGGNWNFVQKIVASDRDASDSFGYSVSLDGDYLVVGAFGESEDEFGSNTMAQSGSAYVFERDGGGTWNEVQKLVASDRAAGDLLGTSVSLSGDYLVLTARAEDEDEAGTNTMSGAGSAYIFERDGGGVWHEVQKVVASDRAADDVFGGYACIEGNYLMVGAFQEDEDEFGGNTLTSSGSVYVFERDGGGIWNEEQKITASDRDANDNFGWSISMSGDKAVIGAYREDEDASGSNTMSAAGSAYIFERDGTGTWNQLQKIVASDRFDSDYFGNAVGISGLTIISGAYREDEDEMGTNTMSSAGSLYSFDYCMTSSSFSTLACEFYTVPSGDETYTTSGIYMDTIPNVSGCDSILTIDVTIGNTSGSTSAFACDSYTVPSGDETYFTSGVYMDTIPNMVGCDSVITINLTLGNSSNTINEASCESYTVPSGDESYTSSGVYMDTIPNMAGCDSILTINLTIHSNTFNSISESACTIYTVPSGDETYTVSGVYMDTIPNFNGCDSIITIDLSINSSTSSLNPSDCFSYTVPSGDETYFSSGVYMDTIPNYLGCDSLITINLTINSSSSSINETTCDSYTVPSGDETYFSPGTYMDTIPNYLGCDSIITINLALNYVDTSVIQNGSVLQSNAVGATYQWVDCNNEFLPITGETGSSYTATSNGDYAVIVTENGCTDTSLCYNVYDVGIKNSSDLALVNIYPNPTTGILYLSVENFTESFTIQISDISGKLILTKTISTTLEMISLEHVESGIYIVRIIDQGQVQTKEILVNK